jgi:hypothetical protein
MSERGGRVVVAGLADLDAGREVSLAEAKSRHGWSQRMAEILVMLSESALGERHAESSTTLQSAGLGICAALHEPPPKRRLLAYLLSVVAPLNSPTISRSPTASTPSEIG